MPVASARRIRAGSGNSANENSHDGNTALFQEEEVKEMPTSPKTEASSKAEMIITLVNSLLNLSHEEASRFETCCVAALEIDEFFKNDDFGPLETTVIPQPMKTLFEPYVLARTQGEPKQAIGRLGGAIQSWLLETISARKPEGTHSSDRTDQNRKGAQLQEAAPQPRRDAPYLKAAKKGLPSRDPTPQPKSPASKKQLKSAAAAVAKPLATVAEEGENDAFETQRKKNRSPKKKSKADPSAQQTSSVQQTLPVGDAPRFPQGIADVTIASSRTEEQHIMLDSGLNFEVVTIDKVFKSYKAEGHTRSGTRVTIFNRGPRMAENAGKNRHAFSVRYALQIRVGRDTHYVMARTNVLLALKWKVPAHEVGRRMASIMQRDKEELGKQLKIDQSLLVRPVPARPSKDPGPVHSEESRSEPPDLPVSESDREPAEPLSSSDSSSVNSA